MTASESNRGMAASDPPPRAAAPESALRRLLLALVLLGAAGLIAELLLLEHWDEWTQWLPLAVLAAVIANALALFLRPTPRSARVFRAVMVVTLVTGVAGLALHFTGNRAFELEMDARLSGWRLTWYALRGATPALAPGAMIQLALLGLLATYEGRGSRVTRRVDPT